MSAAALAALLQLLAVAATETPSLITAIQSIINGIKGGTPPTPAEVTALAEQIATAQAAVQADIAAP